MIWPFKRKVETRAAGSGYTAEIIAAREAYISGRSGLAELTATVQACVSLWEGGLCMADVTGTDLLDRHALAMAGRSLALRGESLFLIREDGLVPCYDWDVTTRASRPRAYRVTLPETGGGRAETVLAAEVLHFRLASDPATPWHGTAPLKRASLTAEVLHAVESALAEVFQSAPLGSQIAHFPDSDSGDMADLRRSFRGRRGAVMVVEGVAQATAAGMHPALGKSPDQLSPDLSKSMTKETLAASRDAICLAYGVLPGLANPATTGAMVRECQRQLAQWTLQPVAELMAEEATQKLGSPVSLDVMRPLQAFDAGGRARALGAIVQTMAAAKEAGLDAAQLAAAMHLVDWKE
ncbi:phage portal protein [Poseidonocella sp. HB161398]|uniref:phage portal protein n=1 Tax=Poseidonocella sp. HB161398 TaxID=2320855 RepID=UPI001107C93D|nr:phage portal protein [Poseidonocella sp. HB161398]